MLVLFPVDATKHGEVLQDRPECHESPFAPPAPTIPARAGCGPGSNSPRLVLKQNNGSCCAMKVITGVLIVVIAVLSWQVYELNDVELNA